MNNNSHTWFIFSLFVRLEWGGVYFDNGDLISPRLYIKTNNWKQFLKNLFISCLFSKIDVSQYLLWV